MPIQLYGSVGSSGKVFLLNFGKSSLKAAWVICAWRKAVRAGVVLVNSNTCTIVCMQVCFNVVLGVHVLSLKLL